MAKFKRGELVLHTRGGKGRACVFICTVDKLFCKIINDMGKIEVLPRFEITKDEQNGRTERTTDGKTEGTAA